MTNRAGYYQSGLFLLNRPEPIRQASLLIVLAAGAGNSESLLVGLQAHAAETGSPWSSRVMGVRTLLEHGQPLSAALAAITGLLPDTTLTAIRIGEETGVLRGVLLDEARRLTQSSGRPSQQGADPGSFLVWLLVTGIVMSTLLSFLMIYIIPKFIMIFYDFDTELPHMTQRLLKVFGWIGTYWPITILPGLTMGFGAAGVLILGLHRRLTTRRILGTEHWPRFWVPDLLRLLSITTASGHPTGPTLTAFRSDLRPGRASRVFQTLEQRAERGQDVLQAMLQTRLLRPQEEAFLRAASRSGHVDWGLRHLGQSIERRRFRWWSRLAHCAEPALVLLMGLCVLFVTTAFILPLIKLINDLA